MLYNENLREEEQHLIQQIAEQTERGKIDWELTEYNPLSFLNVDVYDCNSHIHNPACFHLTLDLFQTV